MMNRTSPSHSRGTPRRPRRGLRHRLAALTGAVTLALGGALALAGPAHADAYTQIAGSAASVPVNTSYTYTVTVPSTVGDETTDLTIDLSGAAATFTGVTNSVGGDLECVPSGTHVQCNALVPVSPGYTVTATVLPTAPGTVTASAVTNFINIVGTDTTTTTITPVGPTYTFTGFFAPVVDPPTVNTMKAGRAVPMKFSLGGDKGLDIFNSGSPTSQQVNCQSGAPTSSVEGTTTAGGSNLSYDAATGQYTYVWKTDSAWKDTCRVFHLGLNDNSDHTADFSFN